MRTKLTLAAFVILVGLLLSACEPRSYTRPTEIHITAGDSVEQAAIALDGEGLSHITGVVDDRVVYYRTRFGSPLLTLTMTMSGSGTNWVQSDPDIAVTADGAAFIVWVERRGGPEKYACYRYIPLAEPPGGYETDCQLLDSPHQTTGNVFAAGFGNVVYAVYDRKYPEGGINSIWFTDLTAGTGNLVYSYADHLESGYLMSMDLAIDSTGALHLAFIDNLGEFTPPRLWYNSNATTNADGSMGQSWSIAPAIEGLEGDVTPSVSFHMSGVTERVNIASVWENPANLDQIRIDSCIADGCIDKDTTFVDLPTSWSTFSVIKDVNLVGIEDTLHLSFIGDDNTAPTGAEQVWYKTNAYDSSDPLDVSNGRATLKYDLDMVKLALPANIYDVPGLPVMSWAESNLISIQYYFYDGLFYQQKVHDTTCLTSVPTGEMASTGYFLSGAWEACSNTWFAARAYVHNLPLVIK